MRQPITSAWSSTGSTLATTSARFWPWPRSTPPMPWRGPSPTGSPSGPSVPSTSPTSWRPGLGRCRNPDPCNSLVDTTATDEFEQQIGMAIGIGEIADLVDHQKTGAGIVTQSPAQGGIAVERGEVAEQLTGADEQHGVTVDEGLMGDVARER